MSCGLDPARFWALTPRELSLHVAGARERFIRDHNELMGLAWHIASLGAFAHHDPKKLPKLQTLLHSDKPASPRAPSADEQIAVLKGIFGARRR